ncbi:MAG: hypothetical protein JSR31_14905 [Nitrospira sp.]|nr:hypothetical protein [Nitrospira sp.]
MREDVLQEFWKAVDNPQSQILAKLDLDHLSRKFVSHLPNFVRSELDLPAASID